MSDLDLDLHQLDAAYVAFPTFERWIGDETVDFSRWERETALLADRARSFSDVLDRARLIATRAAAIDTGALENLYEADRGFTYSVAFETTGWELEVAARGEQVRPLFEAQLQAYEYVLSLATGTEPVSEAAIRELHMQICAAQPTYRVETSIGPREQTLPKGVYKTLPNHVRTRKGTNHSYAPVDMTPSEMHRLVSEMRCDSFLAAHPVTQAAYVHYCFVAIHPFADGNGRVARALASTFTYKAISIPIVILTDQKNSYLDALELADQGNFSAFTNFMLARSLDSAELVLEGLRNDQQASSDSLVADIGALYDRPVLLRSQVDQLGEVLFELVHQALARSAKKLSENPKVKLAVHRTNYPSVPRNDRYRESPRSPVIGTTASSSAPAEASSSSYLILWLPKKADKESELHIADDRGPSVFSARIDQLHPSVSSFVQIRAELFAERHWAKLLSKLKPLAEKALELER